MKVTERRSILINKQIRLIIYTFQDCEISSMVKQLKSYLERVER